MNTALLMKLFGNDDIKANAEKALNIMANGKAFVIKPIKTVSINRIIMQPNISILQKIVQDKKRWIAEKQAAFPLAHFQLRIKNSDRSFYQVLSQGSHQRPAFILECKKASPSKGLIRSDF